MSTARSRLEAALRLLEAEKHDEALVALLACWAETRAPALAARIELVSAALTPLLPPVDLAGHSSVGAAITARLEASGPLDVGPLVDAITRAMNTAPNSYGFLVKLATRHPDDPRVASALHRVVLKPPFARTDGALYGDVVAALEKLNDPRFLPGIVAWSARLEPRRRYIRKERRDLDVLRDCAARISARPPFEAPAWVDELLGNAPTSKPASGNAAHEAALLAAIYADPADTAKRLVYADVLTERGEPRGEFITLQCTRAPGAKPSQRERALLKNHGRAWLGALDSGIRKQGLVYRRGFLAEARECSRDPQLADPAWATIEAVELDTLTWGDRGVAFADREDLRALERLYLRGEDATRLTRERPKLKTLGLRRVSAAIATAVLSKPLFPALAELELEWVGRGVGDVFAAASSGPVLRRTPLVRLVLDDARDVFSLAGVLPVVELIDATGLSDERSDWRLVFSGERLERLHLATTSPKVPRWVHRALRSFTPGQVTAVTADDGVELEASFADALRPLGVLP